MAMLIDGVWTQTPFVHNDEAGKFIRPISNFQHTINRNIDARFQPEKGRYHLYVSYACPWAHRTLIIRHLKGLDNCISISSVSPTLQNQGWEFDSNHPDNINRKHFLYELYQLADPECTARVTVPVLWDKQAQTIVNNESSQILRILNNELNEFAENDYDAYPEHLRADIDKWNDLIYDNINNGVYCCGFATTQPVYETACHQLFGSLDMIEKHLTNNRYLCGEQHTEADWRLFVTLTRFDAVYYNHFKCNLRRIQDYPHLHRYTQSLFDIKGISDTVRFNDIKQHYFSSHPQLNPSGIVPLGPEILF